MSKFETGRRPANVNAAEGLAALLAAVVSLFTAFIKTPGKTLAAIVQTFTPKLAFAGGTWSDDAEARSVHARVRRRAWRRLISSSGSRTLGTNELLGRHDSMHGAAYARALDGAAMAREGNMSGTPFETGAGSACDVSIGCGIGAEGHGVITAGAVSDGSWQQAGSTTEGRIAP